MANGGLFCAFNLVNLNGGKPTSSNIVNDLRGTLGSGTNFELIFGTMEVPQTGKWYWEWRMGGSFDYGANAGIQDPFFTTPGASDKYNDQGYFMQQRGQLQYNGSAVHTISPAIGGNEILGWYVNDGIVKVYIDNTLKYTYSSGMTSTSHYFPSFGASGAISGNNIPVANFGTDPTFQGLENAGASSADANGFGSFHYAPPDGALALCTGNLPISDDIDPAQTDDDYNSKHFGVVTYTGNGGSPDNAVTGLGFKPDLVWGKAISTSQTGILQDTSRGQSLLFSSNGNAQQTSNGPFMASYDADGFTLDGSGSNPNDNNVSYIAWCWRFAGGTTATNNVGNVQTTTQANTKAGQSIVQWTGTGTNSRTIGTGLTKKAEFVIIKSIAESNSWIVYHHQAKQGALPNDYGVLVLNSSQAYGEGSGALTYWDVSEWTDTVFSVGGANGVNGSSDTMLAYAFHSVEGFSKFGCFNGNADNDGTFVYTGFKPTMLWIKNTQSTSPWCVYDTARPTYNPSYLVAWDETTAQNTSSYPIDILSNGFKIRTSNATVNSAHTWVFGAWGNPSFKYNNTF